MNCPRCAATLKPVSYEGVEIETCPGCQGEWLDAGELQTIVSNWEENFSEEERARLDGVNRAHFGTTRSEGGTMTCPKCVGESKLERFVYGGTSGITLDKCPSCEGIWLDENELEQVQMLAEEWQKTLGEDLDSYGDVLEKARKKATAGMVEGQPRFRSGILAFVMRYFTRS